MNVLKEITQKEILYRTNYLSYTKSMLHLPIFTMSKNKIIDKSYHLKIPSLDGFKDISLRFPPLSIKNDFMVFSYILKIFYKNCANNLENPYKVEFNFNELFDFYEVKRNNRSAYSKSIVGSIEGLSRLHMSFSRNDKLYICNFISSAVLDENKARSYKITLSEGFLGFFKHDANLIFNINLDNYKSLSKEFSKILYLYYITNIHKVGKDNVATFDKYNIFTRLQSSSIEKRRWQLIKEANDEIVKMGFIKSYSLTKTNNKIMAVNIVFNDKYNKEELSNCENLNNKENLSNKNGLKYDVSGFDKDNFIDNPENKEIEANKKRISLFGKSKDLVEEKNDEWPF